MRLVENETRLTMNKRRNFVNYADMTLSDGTVLHLTPSDFRVSGNSFTDDWADGESFQIGTAIGKTATLLLDNTDGRAEEIGNGIFTTYPHGKFSEYDFYMAYFVLYVCLPEAYHYEGELRNQMIRIGTFTVTTPTSHGSTIEITGVDNMYMFDKSFDDCDLDFSTNPTLLTILNKCCEDCGVAIGYGSFNNQNLTVSKKPEGVTYRQVVSYIAQIAGCNAKISDTGALILRWYDTSVFADNWLDGGSFTAIGEEFQFQSPLHWDGTNESWGKIIRYATDILPRSGKYKLTKLHISNISDPSNFDADYQINQFQSLNYVSTDRFNSTIVLRNKLVEGDNIINYEFDISTLNRIIYWFGVVGNNYGDPNAATFDCAIYLEPVSYDDLDSADGGTFETEFQYYNTIHWVYEGQSSSSGNWSFYKNITYQLLKPAGRYNITRAFVDNIADPTHFNAIWIVQKSIDSGSTWTDEATGNLVAGDNIINFNVDIPENIETRYRVAYRQNVATDPDASDFDATLYMKANDVHYLDGDNFDGGDFATPLNYHNLISTNGTSVSTDDIQFTGVLVQGEDTSAHYPTYDGWDNYAMVISDNPFVAGYEDTIALYIYSQLQGLKFRPFTTSSNQDPTIEAGDCALVYDVKGNMYKTIITNVTFKTGGMTELSCNAEPPTRQNSRYVNPAAQQAVAKAEKKMNDYNAQVAHFNEIASQALGYYKTIEADTKTGAIITYLHNNPTLETSTNVIKITADGIFISEDGGQSYNSGFDTSTGTMLLNLIYVHGLTSDWIRTGELDVGGLNNEDGIIRVANRFNVSDPVILVEPNTVMHFFVGPGQIKTSGSYRIFYDVYDFETGKPQNVQCMIQKRDKWDGTTYTWKTIQEYYPLTSNSGELPIRFDVDIDDGDMYYYVTFSRLTSSNALFTGVLSYNKINTIIDKDGVEIKSGVIKLNGKDALHTNAAGVYMGSDGIAFGRFDSDTNHSVFEVTSDGKIYASDGEIAGLTVDWWEKGWDFNGKLSVYHNGSWHDNVDHYFKISAYGGITCGRLMSPSTADADQEGWSNLWWVQGYGMLQIDYGPSTNNYRGIIVTNSGNNRYYDAGSNYLQIFAGTIYKNSTGQEVQWGTSDERLKKNIKDLTLDEAYNLINIVRPRSFELKHQDGVRYGFIAQELREHLSDNSAIEQTSDETGYHYINYNDFVAPLCMIVKEQQAEIDDLKKRIEALETLVNTNK